MKGKNQPEVGTLKRPEKEVRVLERLLRKTENFKFIQKTTDLTDIEQKLRQYQDQLNKIRNVDKMNKFLRKTTGY